MSTSKIRTYATGFILIFLAGTAWADLNPRLLEPDKL